MKKTNNLIIEKAYINGKWEKGKKKFAVINPADNKIIAEVADLSVKETQTAIKSAHKASLSWRHETAQYRCDLLSRFDQLINENKDDTAEIITWESGKPISESYAEISYGASFVSWFAEEGKRAYGETIPSPNQIGRASCRERV